MTIKARMTKVPEYARPHQRNVIFGMGLESAVANTATIVPIITQDEGLGAISAYESNPENANFVEAATAHCYPTSRINQIFCEASFNLTKGAIQTDKLPALKFATMEIHTAFNETGLALDEKSTLDLNEVLELQVEATDRQTFPLYNTVDMKDGKANAWLDMSAEQLGLDTDLELEGIAFQDDKYYDCLHYYTTGNKLRTVTSGLHWHTLTPQHPFKTLRFHQHSNTKYMNPYTFLGILIYCPLADSEFQYGKAADTTDIVHMDVNLKYRYNEWNHEYNHAAQ